MNTSDHFGSSEDSVTVRVDGVSHRLEPILLSKYSHFFACAINGNWQENTTGIIDLDDDLVSAPAFTAFHQFLRQFHAAQEDSTISWEPSFTRAIRHVLDNSSQSAHLQPVIEYYKVIRGNKKGFAYGDTDSIFHGAINMSIERLIECYHVGEYLGAPTFCNAIMDILKPKIKDLYENSNNTRGHGSIPLWSLHTIFSGMPGSGLQRFFADLIFHEFSEDGLNRIISEDLLDENGLKQISLAGARYKQRYRYDNSWMLDGTYWDLLDRDPGLRDRCLYHDHPKTGRMKSFDFDCSDGWDLVGDDDNGQW